MQDNFSINQSEKIARLEVIFKNIRKQLDVYGRKKEEDVQRFASAGVEFDWMCLTKRKEMTVDLSKRCVLHWAAHAWTMRLMIAGIAKLRWATGITESNNSECKNAGLSGLSTSTRVLS